ncbi:MFS transporter [endosymbiont of unidentified scaly snail isolate Monju]|uniref:MFS transporter n=1 Tax=endosymbiont of unidentified scaly snail isolate Monju TaxID=1248727 RepID=UPI0003892598|nr:MFS transporter [endosymbiont of unidentified scaly snail isolate Monju]BAN69272.1 major facilitator transporter [endosymbiont of unidentified scaly snail isolate Monju]
MQAATRHYAVITAGYWGFTLTDGAIRMLVVLYFHQLGYSPFEVAMLFLFYEFFGVVTNLVGGWLGARIGLNLTMHIGMALQIVALLMLTAPDAWLSVPWVMAAQALSGIAKDLNKMSAKASVKAITAWLLPAGVGRMRSKPRFTQVFSRVAAVNWLSAARFLLFGARDVWFVVALPVFLYDRLGWDFWQVGSFLALWVIGYGLVQATTPGLLRGRRRLPGGRTALYWVATLALVPTGMALALDQGLPPHVVLIGGLTLFGLVFAVNSAVHSYLILAYSEQDDVALRVGFYYMANAGGRLAGTVLSGLIYQQQGIEGCLWWSAGMLAGAALLSLPLPQPASPTPRHPAGAPMSDNSQITER